jgi:hypothetical protein
MFTVYVNRAKFSDFVYSVYTHRPNISDFVYSGTHTSPTFQPLCIYTFPTHVKVYFFCAYRDIAAGFTLPLFYAVHDSAYHLNVVQVANIY